MTSWHIIWFFHGLAVGFILSFSILFLLVLFHYLAGVYRLPRAQDYQKLGERKSNLDNEMTNNQGVKNALPKDQDK